ncbi:MAG: hypothetical protein U1E33_02490 [Rhodospirillales bacterium]
MRERLPRHRYEVNNNYIGTLERCGWCSPACRRTACCRRSPEVPAHP